MFKSVLVLCIGNICRSPVMEGLLKKYSDQHNLGLSISSAGVHAMVDEPAQPYSIEISEKNNIDISTHRARQVTADMIVNHDIILVTDETVRKIAIQQFPMAMGKIKKLGDFRHLEISDPYRQPKEAFKQMYIDIDNCMQDWLQKVWKVK